jgi:hypothetical protein
VRAATSLWFTHSAHTDGAGNVPASRGLRRPRWVVHFPRPSRSTGLNSRRLDQLLDWLTSLDWVTSAGPAPGLAHVGRGHFQGQPVEEFHGLEE